MEFISTKASPNLHNNSKPNGCIIFHIWWFCSRFSKNSVTATNYHYFRCSVYCTRRLQCLFFFFTLYLLFVLFISTLYSMSFSRSLLANTDISRCVFAPVNWKIFMQQWSACPTDWVTCCVIIIETEKNLICSLICGEQLKAMMVTMMALIRPYCRSGEWQQRNIT